MADVAGHLPWLRRAGFREAVCTTAHSRPTQLVNSMYRFSSTNTIADAGSTNCQSWCPVRDLTLRRSYTASTAGSVEYYTSGTS